MKQIIAALALSTMPYAALAEEPPKSDAPVIEGLDELADGMRKLLEGFTDDMVPLMEDMTEQLKGLNAYHPPEVLPNGDIIIRRKKPSDTLPKAEDKDEEAIDI